MSDLGELVTIDGRAAVRFDRYLAHPIERVSRAVTEPEHLRAWFPTTIDGERTAGAPLRFRFPDQPDAEPFDGQFLAFEPPRLMELAWGPDRLRIELVADGDSTRLTLTDVVDEIGKAARDAAGWHTCLEALVAQLDGTGTIDSNARWGAVHPRYVESFGPGASTIGPPEGHPAAQG